VRGRLPDELVARPPMLGHDLPQPRGVGLVHWLDDLFPLLQVMVNVRSELTKAPAQARRAKRCTGPISQRASACQARCEERSI
jgi:hypothetical protein